MQASNIFRCQKHIVSCVWQCCLSDWAYRGHTNTANTWGPQISIGDSIHPLYGEKKYLTVVGPQKWDSKQTKNWIDKNFCNDESGERIDLPELMTGAELMKLTAGELAPMCHSESCSSAGIAKRLHAKLRNNESEKMTVWCRQREQNEVRGKGEYKGDKEIDEDLAVYLKRITVIYELDGPSKDSHVKVQLCRCI